MRRSYCPDLVKSYLALNSDRAVPVDVEARLMADGISLRKLPRGDR